MPLRWPRGMGASSHVWLLFAIWATWLSATCAMSPARMAELRQETVSMFYHGYDNYMRYAFPEDELRPISCRPLTRDPLDPTNIGLNDALGNYSLTLIDSLSTLAILASAPPDREHTGAKALGDFQKGVVALVEQYGDGSSGPAGKGLRGRGFDVDSKVQVFETVIRGVGGLLSAHLFATGELPITGYNPEPIKSWKGKLQKGEIPPIAWPKGFKYNGQLLRLALDMAQRLLPAFYTPTGMPYPRVNLRYGIPFYQNSPLNKDAMPSENSENEAAEITETCTAGAGSLVLEFTVLSRLTGDPRFEQLAKRAFWAVWNRRSQIGLLGMGIDAESGQWIGANTGIGASVDSFFEYALKSYILLSGHSMPNTTIPLKPSTSAWLDPNTLWPDPLTDEENTPESFLEAWQEAHAAVRRHLYSNTHHPHYVNARLDTGSPNAYWIDSLGAFYPGLLALAGEIEEAIETNLLYTALWTRYAALPERFSVRDGRIEGGLGWWPGRPEFIESNYHLYRATQDPWYLHVGEMVLRDIQRRCWQKCGWAGLQDVDTGELKDRMESFFLGETTKYAYLLFDPRHPLNSLDAAYVFTTEGHPLIIPKKEAPPIIRRKATSTKDIQTHSGHIAIDACPVAQSPLPFSVSSTAARRDVFHASNLIGLDQIKNWHAIDTVDVTISKDTEFTNEQDELEFLVPNHTYYPWTLPETLLPSNGICDKLPLKHTFTVEFPNNAPVPTQSGQTNFIVLGPNNLVRWHDGILVKSLSGLKLAMVYENPSPFQTLSGPLPESWRIFTIAGVPMGRDEQIYLPRDVIGELNDPSFRRVRDPMLLDVVLQLENPPEIENATSSVEEFYIEEDFLSDENEGPTPLALQEALESATGLAENYKTMISSFLRRMTSAVRDPAATITPKPENPITYQFLQFPAITPSGRGTAPLPDIPDAPNPYDGPKAELLTWQSIYFADTACEGKLPDEAARQHQVIVIIRGQCTFQEKLTNIPTYSPSSSSLQLVIVVDPEDNGDEEGTGANLFRPLLDKPQVTPSGLTRMHPIPMVVMGGGEAAIDLLRQTRSIGLRRRYHVESQGLVVGNVHVI